MLCAVAKVSILATLNEYLSASHKSARAKGITYKHNLERSETRIADIVRLEHARDVFIGMERYFMGIRLLESCR